MKIQQPESSTSTESPGFVPENHRFGVLDGWRAVSILLVLSAHLLPLGPHRWNLNEAAARAGMSLFFTLSGFLITKALIEQPNAASFLMRRLFRIVPLAWLALAICMPLWEVEPSAYISNFLFFANLPPQHLQAFNSHFWSLDVEVQFYLGIALVVAVSGRRGLLLIPVVCLGVSIHRLWSHAHADIVTWRRVDEILAGGIIALAVFGELGSRISRILTSGNSYLLLALLALTSIPASGDFNCARAYIAALLVASTLFNAPAHAIKLLHSRPMAYIAKISFALYVIHGIFQTSWIGTGDTFVKYAKRPALFALTFGLAHLSTFYYEQPAINFGKRFAARFSKRRRNSS